MFPTLFHSVNDMERIELWVTLEAQYSVVDCVYLRLCPFGGPMQNCLIRQMQYMVLVTGQVME